MSIKDFNISTDKILSLSAIVIAIVSISVAVWEGLETRKHNRLSVRPKLEIYYSTNKSKFGYVVVNNGLGPAVITGKKIFIDGKEITYTGFSGYDDFLEKLGLADRYAAHGVITPGFTIKAGKSENIILFDLYESDEAETLLPEIYRRVAIEIEYKSMYDEIFTCRIPSNN
ncbi:MAG TPA: hypothetical protein ENK44_12965 [Caldithrix abyssi]|uniref:Uncharacterized protein n=1 Tax=Caldithrix abyssi TaxID=187145 RepID=A0A7V4WW72_CALAY|nr:hypothetical protein [Caldithrix abyssi]